MAIGDCRIDCLGEVVKSNHQMIARKADTRGWTALGTVEQSGMKIVAATCDLEANRNLLSMNCGIAHPRADNCVSFGSLSRDRESNQEKAGEELHRRSRFFLTDCVTWNLKLESALSADPEHAR